MHRQQSVTHTYVTNSSFNGKFIISGGICHYFIAAGHQIHYRAVSVIINRSAAILVGSRNRVQKIATDGQEYVGATGHALFER